MTPLAGLRVLDLSRVLAGPWCTQWFADLGAEVVKVEHPGRGDDTRGWGPPWVGEGEARTAAYFGSANRGKRAVAIDIARPEGQALVRDLAATSDVVVENFKVGALARYGLDAASLRALHPRLVYCSITGFGQDGPYAARPGYDFVIQGMGGLMSVTGEAGGEPTKAGVALVDVMTGLYAANAIQAALIRRAATGEGATIDAALLDTAVATLANQAANYLSTGRSPARHGNAHPNIVPYQSFAAADARFTLAVGNDAQFARLAAVVGRPEWASDPRFATNPARVANKDALVGALAAAFAARPAAEWLARLEVADVPAGPINDLAAVFADPHVVARGLAVERGGVRGVAAPVTIDGIRPVADAGPPRLAEHTDAVLRERLGLDADRIAALRGAGVIG